MIDSSKDLENLINAMIPDARDGLTQRERTVLYCLYEAQQEFGDRNVPTVTLYGRVIEKCNMSVDEMQSILSRFAGPAMC